jgi:V/A-type H+-transporting ATPase subunit E
MSAEKIVEKILTDARTEAQRLLESARQQAAQIREQAHTEAQRQRELILAQAHEEAQSRRRAHRAAANAASRNAALAARRAVLDTVFEQTAAKLTALPPAEYRNWLIRLVLQATETGAEELILSPADRQALGDSFLKEANAQLSKHDKRGALKLSVETRDIGRGFVLKGKHNEINVTIATLLRRAQDALEIEVAQMLFGEGRDQHVPEGTGRGR